MQERVLHETRGGPHQHRRRRRTGQTVIDDHDREQIAVACQGRPIVGEEGLRQGGGPERRDTAQDLHRAPFSGGPSVFRTTSTSSRRRKSTSGRSSTSLVNPSPS